MTKNEIYWEIDVCKQSLKATDYKAIKHSEGLISDEDYEEIKSQREEWRASINSYEEMIVNEEYDEETFEDSYEEMIAIEEETYEDYDDEEVFEEPIANEEETYEDNDEVGVNEDSVE